MKKRYYQREIDLNIPDIISPLWITHKKYSCMYTWNATCASNNCGETWCALNGYLFFNDDLWYILGLYHNTWSLLRPSYGFICHTKKSGFCLYHIMAILIHLLFVYVAVNGLYCRHWNVKELCNNIFEMSYTVLTRIWS